MDAKTIHLKDKKKTIATFVIVTLILIAATIINYRWHARIDCTTDSKFSLSQPSKKMLSGLKDVVNIKVLMSGKLPSNYTKLLQGTTDMLTSIKEQSNGKVQFVFENPVEGKTEEEKTKISAELGKKGLSPMPIINENNEGDGAEKRYVYPFATISANGKEATVCLIENHSQMDMDGILNYSESMLEYKVCSAIKALQSGQREKIAYLVGHGEPMNVTVIDALYSLGQYYSVDTLDLTKGIEISPAYKCAIMCRPTIAFTDKEKFKIDQYVMAGGRLFMAIDQVNINMDTMAKTPTYTALPYDLNLDDLLFKYGVRINGNLIEDLQCAKLQLVLATQNNQPVKSDESWVYFPLVTPISQHPIVQNMDAVLTKFASAIDTVANGLNKKTVLLSSSQYSRALGTPLEVSFNSIRTKPKSSMFTKKYLPIAVALEGSFNSLYGNKVLPPEFLAMYQDSLGKKFRETTAKPNKLIVVSDADIMMNDYSQKYGPSELGFHKDTRELFANKTFLLNAIEYLVDDNSMLEARSKNVQLRLLDKKKIKDNRTVMQFLNIILPIFLVIFFGSAYIFFRRKKYEQVVSVNNKVTE